jgi:hypothetical protein
MAIHRTNVQNVQGEIMLPKIKHIVAYLAKPGGAAVSSALDVAELDLFVGSYIEKGYHLVTTHFLGENTDGYGILYILSL